MTSKMQPTTIRLTEDDQTFLASLKISGCSTISDKVRSLIQDRRLLLEAGRDFHSALQQSSTLLAPQQDFVRMAENQLGMHSQMLRRTLAWTQEWLALLLSTPEVARWEDADRATLEKFEALVAEHLQRLMEILLQTYISRDSALYRVESLSPDRMRPLQRLYRLIEEDKQNNN